MAHTFCNALLREARASAKEHGVEVPKGLTVWRDSHSSWAEVWGPDKMLWSGHRCCCASIAKSNFIMKLVDEAIEAKEAEERVLPARPMVLWC